MTNRRDITALPAVIIDPARVAGLRVSASDVPPPDLEGTCNSAIVVSVLLDTGVTVPVYAVGTRWDEDDDVVLKRVNWVLDCLRDDLGDRTQHLWRASLTAFGDDAPVVLA